MKTPEKSRFGKLVAYLLDPQGKKTRVGEVVITNCVFERYHMGCARNRRDAAA